ncbi:replication protein A 70 kDa DNA-binding subunit [Phlebotomus argentipes]|uniref:replication protein A 70 kDa DNA-binding subunit n=1 Tax=Phlebotomus argentipes TaxID=94469 RepID=UPI0028934129|nr:replication protein A 70 kDa DNA-binding subunit [Phlebotomus argentipes]
MSVPQLTTGAIKRLTEGSQEKPILQMLGKKQISQNDSERYRLLISDGVHVHSFAILNTQLNYLIHDGSLCDYTVFRLQSYSTSKINKEGTSDRHVIVMAGVDVLMSGDQVGERIGTPVNLDQKGSNSSAMGATSSTPASSGRPQNSPRVSVQRGNAGDSGDLRNSAVNPICSLTPYVNKWVIKARVVQKASIRTWKNDRGEGKLFSFEVVDESGEIRATAFREQVDKFYDMLQVDKVYLISRCTMKPADKRFNTTKNDYELTLNSDTVIQECPDDMNTPKVQYNFVPISQIVNLEANSMIDVIGVCSNAGEMVQFTARSSGRELRKRDLTLVDQSKASVILTLWGDDAESFEATYQPVVCIKGCRVTEFGGGKTVSLIGNSMMKLNPDIPEGHRVRGWFDNGGSDEVSTNVSTRIGGAAGIKTEWVTFHEAKVRSLGMGDAPDYFQTKAIVHLVRMSSAVYKSCPQGDCNKKVVDQDDGTYRCEKCNTSYANFKYRFLVSMSIGDWTSNRWVTCFNEVAEQIIGRSAQEVGELLSMNPDEAETVLSGIHFKSFIFKLRIKMEHFGDTSRNKITVVAATPVNHKDYNEYLINNLSNLTGIATN